MLLTMLKVGTYNFVLGCDIDAIALIIPSLFLYLFFLYLYIYLYLYEKFIIFILKVFIFEKKWKFEED